MTETFRIQRFRFALPLLFSTLAACGGSSGAAPTISNLSIKPSTVSVGTASTVTGTLVVSDGDLDETEIDATITLPNGQSQALPPTVLQGAATQTSAAIQFAMLIDPPTAGKYVVSITVKDMEGMPSNTEITTIIAQ
jgi:hypothetical protein